eukprot:gene24880-biopygen11947
MEKEGEAWDNGRCGPMDGMQGETPEDVPVSSSSIVQELVRVRVRDAPVAASHSARSVRSIGARGRTLSPLWLPRASCVRWLLRPHSGHNLNSQTSVP